MVIFQVAKLVVSFTPALTHCYKYVHTHTLHPHASLSRSQAAEAVRWKLCLSRVLKKAQVLWEKDTQNASSFFSALQYRCAVCLHVSFSLSSPLHSCPVWAWPFWKIFLILWTSEACLKATGMSLWGLPSASTRVDEWWRHCDGGRNKTNCVCVCVCVSEWLCSRCLCITTVSLVLSAGFRGHCCCVLSVSDGSSFVCSMTQHVVPVTNVWCCWCLQRKPWLLLDRWLLDSYYVTPTSVHFRSRSVCFSQYAPSLFT